MPSNDPLPGDLVIRCREEHEGSYHREVYVLYSWPERDIVRAGPYQSYDYALATARARSSPATHLWLDDATAGEAKLLRDITT